MESSVLGQFEELGLWHRNIGEGTAPDRREQLRASYRQFWNNAVELSREIQRDLPQLTLHDDRHFEALWARADQVAGNEFKLTPLEVFVFGGAILLHDAANSLAAFPGRLAAVEATSEWRDALAQWAERQDEGALSEPDVETRRALLLDTLRAIHAERALDLADFEVETVGRRHYLLDDDQLRTHLGALIGEIAASHHWDTGTLANRLGGTRGSLAGMPADWTIRPILLAGLLRCADATQLDQDRAPDFLFGLLQLRGLSEQHWRAQNRLAHPYVDPAQPEALVFTSTRPFLEEDASAWWIAYDALSVANRELQATDALLRDVGLPPLQVNRVRGAETPDRLAALVQVSGWRPVLADVRISRVDRIVELFGGEKLYGHQMWVPVRELIQNAADAIRYRRELEPENSPYSGRIVARLRDDGADHVRIEIEDDGLGMSEAVLTGPLIDFGESYISSSLVKAERPGLLSKGRKRTGKFGVGFFSTFMIADEITVLSRPFDQGLDQSRTLKFSKGAPTRPILLDAGNVTASATVSTRVTLKLARTMLEQVLHFDSAFSRSETPVTFTEMIGALCPMLDVDIFVDVAGQNTKIHSRNWFDEDRAAWLRRISLPHVNKAINVSIEAIEAEIAEAAPRLTFLDPDDPSAGLAAVSGVAARGVRAVGMFRATEGFNQYANDFWGAVDYQPAGPRRSFGPPRSRTLLADWATKQALLAAQSVPVGPQQRVIARRVADFDGDATPIASISFDREWLSLEEAFDKACRVGRVYAPIMRYARQAEAWSIGTVRERQSGFIDNYFPNELEFLVPIIEGSDSSENAFYAIPTTDRPAHHSFLGMMNRLCASRSVNITGRFLERFAAARYVGEDSPRQRLTHGSLIHCNVLELTFSKPSEMLAASPR
ncbi:ATP-binding protein [Sphingomonas donggukensis]|uniref:ATP-binding protein n=1 Tax=Sphingomonas donggukensis TaxID=2949093 RepID=A0ABY4TQ95_9SPHN|nr:ATP-binding protein [Sphingomonas donggukensis]URW74561.1 ATP-binding protein [Sphingomonas donggukensis]